MSSAACLLTTALAKLSTKRMTNRHAHALLARQRAEAEGECLYHRVIVAASECQDAFADSTEFDTEQQISADSFFKGSTLYRMDSHHISTV